MILLSVFFLQTLVATVCGVAIASLYYYAYTIPEWKPNYVSIYCFTVNNIL